MPLVSQYLNKLSAWLLLGLSVSLASCTEDSPPTEAEVIARFERSAPALSTLAQMSDEDFSRTGVTRIADHFTRLKDNWAWPRADSTIGVSPERWTEYRRLFKSTEFTTGLDRQGPQHEMIMFSFWGVGLADNMLERGVLYSAISPASKDSEASSFHVVPIRGHWYAYEWRTW